MRFPRRFREERAHAHRADDARKLRELQRAYSYELDRNPWLSLR